MTGFSSRLRALGLAALLGLMAPLTADAEALRVSPVMLEIPAPAATATLTLGNQANQPRTVQIRVFRWLQEGGQERFVPMSDVVASPPMTELAPGARQTVRIVRPDGAPQRGEEAYRLFIDEVPDRTVRQGGTVRFATRFRIPVFFVEPGARLPQVEWSVRQHGNMAVLEARNIGDTRLRIADAELRRGGNVVYSKNGLFGYVLGGATMQWPLGPVSRIGTAGLELQASTSQGLLHAPVAAR